jgi:hypothetical protein
MRSRALECRLRRRAARARHTTRRRISAVCVARRRVIMASTGQTCFYPLTRLRGHGDCRARGGCGRRWIEEERMRDARCGMGHACVHRCAVRQRYQCDTVPARAFSVRARRKPVFLLSYLRCHHHPWPQSGASGEGAPRCSAPLHRTVNICARRVPADAPCRSSPRRVLYVLGVQLESFPNAISTEALVTDLPHSCPNHAVSRVWPPKRRATSTQHHKCLPPLTLFGQADTIRITSAVFGCRALV